MKGFPKFLITLGRVCISLFFILSGMYKIIYWQKTGGALNEALGDWHSYAAYSEIAAEFFAYLIVWAPFILVAALIMELLGGILVFIGFRVQLGAILLILCFIPATIFFHPFWFFEGGEREMHLGLFFKNLALLGGLLYVLAFAGKKTSPMVE